MTIRSVNLQSIEDFLKMRDESVTQDEQTDAERKASAEHILDMIEPESKQGRTQELLEANSRLTDRARYAEGKLAAITGNSLNARIHALIADATREAFKAGWRTNAVPETEESKEALDSGEDVDWLEYQAKGIDTYLQELADAAKIEDEISEPEVLAFEPGGIIPMDSALTFFNASEIVPKLVTASGISINLQDGTIDIPEEMSRTAAAVEVWRAVEIIAQRRLPQRRVRHKARGSIYEVIGEAEGQISQATFEKGRLLYEGDMITVYRDEATGKLWWRCPDEFNDGRFEDLP